MKEVKVRDLIIGRKAECKICAPIVGRTEEEILAQAVAVKQAKPDLAELRIDYFEAAEDLARTKGLLAAARNKLGNLPLIFTLRTKEEGGELSVSPDFYEETLIMAARSGLVDFVDVELNLGEEFVQSLVLRLKELPIFVIISNHDFETTKDQQELLRRMQKMQRLGADIAKIAVMPQTAADVLCLLEATNIMLEQYAQIPLVTMAMGKLGTISRVSGALFGSSITFASVEKTSAPGQLRIEDARRLMDILN